jgi:protein TonB
MNANSILHSDVLDILFENRNKQYGAYTLRKEYNKRLMTAIGGMFSLVVILVVCLSFKTKDKTEFGKTVIISNGPTIIIPPAKPRAPEPHVLPKPLKLAGGPKLDIASIKNNTIQIVPDDKVMKTEVPTNDDMVNKVISNETNEGKPGNDNMAQSPGGGGDGKGNGPDNVTAPPAEDNTIYKSAEYMPEYPGGTSAMIRFLKKNLREITNEEEHTVKVLVRFIVDKTGAVTGFEIVGSGGEEYDKEVLRVMKKMPHWKPGSQNGNTVNVYMTLPVVFQTESE